ncbi:hypothetical protein [Gordonia phthalatica]|uniref:Secreted protein n=1 Tax=Gordonia phthalatica TaxID=1136941 RepID=A0A0N9NMA0_9ACTN|nr:hypothetical protein [Gordonia phthalatica]ALG86960.1 hypothetical protein ACH46_15955 [Gordonia phthalatica]
MSTHTLRRRIAGAVATAAVFGTGLAVPTITEAGPASAAECNQTSLTKRSDAFADYIFQKSVPAQVGEGTSVTYSVAVSTTGSGNPYVQKVRDLPATVLENVKPTVEVKAFTLIGGILGGGGAFGDLIEKSTVNPANVHQDRGGWRIDHTGYAVFAGKAFVAEFTYKLPSSIKAGTQFVSRGAAINATPAPTVTEVAVGAVCTNIRGQNAGEAISGSMDSNGLGSSDGQLSSTGGLGDIVGGMLS